MIRIAILCLAVLLVWVRPGGAYAAADATLDGGDCAAVHETYDDLGREIAVELDRLAAAVAAAKADKGMAAAGLVQASQTRLLDLIYQQDCVRTDLPADPVLVRGPNDPRPGWITVTTYYATNRRAVGTGASLAYGADRTPVVQFGRAVISIPTRRRPGEVNLPLSLWTFELPTDPSKHFILKSVTPLGAGPAQAEMRARMAGLSKKSVLLFVHGFNVTFEGAALHTAQLAHDLDFPGLAMFYSWPSLGEPKGYARDEEMAQLSIPALRTVLAQLNAIGATEVVVVAHSMGNRIVGETLRQQVAAHHGVGNLKALMLAAPDINSDIFREQIAPALASLPGVSRTIYAADSDLALKASHVLHDFRRVGDASGGDLVYAGFETVDASRAAPVARGYGHSYVLDSPPVLGDLQDLILLRYDAQRRGLARQGQPPLYYWRLP